MNHPFANGSPPRVAPSDRGAFVIIAATAVLVALVAFGWTLDGYFVGDDFAYVGRYFEFPFARWPSLWVQGWADGLWGSPLRELRPLNAFLFMADGHVWGLNPFGFRLTNVGLHAVCAALVGRLAWRVSGRDLGCGVAAAALFALHPVQAETVEWVCGRVELLTTAFALAGFLAFLSYREHGGRRALLAMTGWQAATIFTKEAGYTFPLLLLAADLVWRPAGGGMTAARRWAPYACCAGVLAIYGGCRQAAFGDGSIGGVGHGWPDVASASTYEEFFRRQLHYLSYLFAPAHTWLRTWLHDGWSLQPQHLLRAGLLVAQLGAAGWALGCWRKRTGPGTPERRAGLFFGAGWYLVSTVPLMMTYFSARHLYPAVAGLIVAAVLLLRTVARPRTIFVCGAAALAIFEGTHLAGALQRWREGARVSRELAAAVALTAPEVERNGAVLLDVPDLVDGAFCWSFAVPYAVRPPFLRERLDDRVAVVGRPAAFAFSNWAGQPAIEALARVDRDSWVIRVTREGEVRRIRVAPEKFRPVAEKYLALPPAARVAGWEDFVARLAAP